ncbi:MAG: 4Fe-4S binding protein [Candidatus Omnitrophica bacterium]|nr:4Fe-4S binding protein [Candidatus Omnitrophota bacterium]
MKKPKLREIREALTSLFSRPYTSRFPAEPHVPMKSFRGKPQFDPEKCVGCGACASVCPSRAIELIDDLQARRRKLTHFVSRCIFCGQCEANCIVDKQGIRLTNEFHLAYFDEKESTHSVEHELVICERCGAIIGPVKHLLWTIKKTGPLMFSQPVLITFYQQSVRIETEIRPDLKNKSVDRTDIFRVICPKCRREAWLVDEKIPLK